jgi:hypothetical protein
MRVAAAAYSKVDRLDHSLSRPARANDSDHLLILEIDLVGMSCRSVA